MNDEDVEARLERWRPARPPPNLMRRLHAAVPTVRKERRCRRHMGQWLGELSRRPWPVAYAGLLAAWVLILMLRLTTPPEPACATAMISAQTADAPAFAHTLAAERTFFLAGNSPDELPP